MYLLRLMGLVELLVKLLALLVLLVRHLIPFSLVVVEHGMQRILDVAHEATVKDGSTVFFVPLSETRVLV